MNARLHPTLARAMLPVAPAGSIVHRVISEDRARQIDAALHADKLADGYGQRNEARALELQFQRQDCGGVL